MANFIIQNAGLVANGALAATNYFTGKQSAAQIAAGTAGTLIGMGTEAAAASAFTTLAEIGAVALMPSLATAGAVGLALSPAAALVAGTVATIAAQSVLSSAFA